MSIDVAHPAPPESRDDVRLCEDTLIAMAIFSGERWPINR